MRIAYVVPEFPSQTHAFFWREVSALREDGHVVDLVSTSRPAPDACRHEFADQARTETTYLVPPRVADVLRCVGTTDPRRWWRVLRYVVRCRPRSPSELVALVGVAVCAGALLTQGRRRSWDHIHIHSCADAAHLGAMSRMLGGPTYSLTLHGDLAVYGRNHSLKMAGASFVSAVTRPLQQQVMAETGLPASRVPVICMGVDSARFSAAGAVRTERHAGALRLLTIARLNFAKGHVFALRAMRVAMDRGLDLHYTIAGSGDHHDAIEAEVDALGLRPHVELVGTLSEGEVLDLLSRTDVFVLPSFGEGEAAPVAVMEAMACEVPVIASVIGGTPDMISSRRDGLLVPQQDVEAIAEAMVELATSPELRATIGRNARLTALADFDYQSNARQLGEQISRG